MRETPLSCIWAHTADVNESDKQKSGFLDLLRKPKVVHADGQGAVPFLLEMVTVAGMGLQGQKLLMSSFTLQVGWDQLTQTMEEGSAGENSIPLGGVLGEMEEAAVLKQLAPPTCQGSRWDVEVGP